jgi:hypothetical protein
MSGWGSNQPTGLVQAASVSIGSSNTVTLINATPNGVRLISLAMSSIAVSPIGGAGVRLATEDVVNDTNGVQYCATEIGFTASNEVAVTSGATLDEGGIVVPAGASVQLVNGGGGGTTALRRCSASATYIIL